MLLIEFGLNGRPCSLTWPAAFSSALIRRSDMRSPVLGLARCRRFAKATASGPGRLMVREERDVDDPLQFALGRDPDLKSEYRGERPGAYPIQAVAKLAMEGDANV